MKKEIFITVVIAAALAACVFLLSGCGGKQAYSNKPIYPGADLSEQDLYILGKLANMEVKSDCLTCIGCISMKGSADCCGNVDGQYFGCVDCTGATASDSDDPLDYYKTVKICDGCYCVNFPLYNDSKVAPAYGCMTNV